MPLAPSQGKAIICIYRVGAPVGSAAHDHLYVNGVYLATLLNGEYAWTEVEPGTAIVNGMAKMYYGPSVIMSSAAAVNQTRGQAERIRVEAEAGKNYYMKWTSGMFATEIKVKLMDAEAASFKAREYRRGQGRKQGCGEIGWQRVEGAVGPGGENAVFSHRRGAEAREAVGSTL